VRSKCRVEVRGFDRTSEHEQPDEESPQIPILKACRESGSAIMFKRLEVGNAQIRAHRRRSEFGPRETVEDRTTIEI
jgi:hypothetical protein